MILLALGAAPMTPPQDPPAHSPIFPIIASADLTGRKLTLPSDLTAERTILILAFDQPQQRQVDAWVKGLNLSPGTLDWLEVPVVDQPGLMGRFFIDSGMRSGIPDLAMRRHVVTLYTDKRALLASLAISGDREVVVIVLDRAGKVWARASGPFDPKSAEPIQRAAGRPSTPTA